MNGTKSHETKKDGQPLFNKDFGRLFCLFLQAGEEGLEPPFTVLETVALPLNYSPSMRYFCMPEYNTIIIEQCQHFWRKFFKKLTQFVLDTYNSAMASRMFFTPTSRILSVFFILSRLIWGRTQVSKPSFTAS